MVSIVGNEIDEIMVGKKLYVIDDGNREMDGRESGRVKIKRIEIIVDKDEV